MRFPTLFICLLILELIAVLIASKTLEYVFKPSLMLALGIYFFQETNKMADKKQSNRVLAGIFFSLLGDVLLMFSGGFIFGLSAFLIAHICYISAFLIDNNGFVFTKRDRLIPALGILAYSILFLSIVLPNVSAALQLPVGVYGITITAMLLSALNRWKNVESASFKWVLIGAILFVISDSILAINRFVQPLPLSGIAIMLTYAAGQFFIIKGVLAKFIFHL